MRSWPARSVKGVPDSEALSWHTSLQLGNVLLRDLRRDHLAAKIIVARIPISIALDLYAAAETVERLLCGLKEIDRSIFAPYERGERQQGKSNRKG